MIVRWIAQALGDDDFNAREEATQKLWQAGDQAEPALQEAAKSDDAEISRCQGCAGEVQMGPLPQTNL